MTKKKKIILSSVIVGVILIGVILTIILVNIKRFDMKESDKYIYNNHTQMLVIDRDPTYSYYDYGELYKNGTQLISKPGVNGNPSTMGVYSYVENKIVVEPIYSDVSVVTGNTDTTKSYFRCNLSSAGNMVKIVDEYGQDLTFLKYDEDNKVSTSEIKTRTVDLSQSKNSVKSKINKKYHYEQIKIQDAHLISGSTYYCCYTDNETYTYEVWELRTTDNLTYINLYELENGKHKLIQTLNNQLGVSLESQNFTLTFLTDGTPILLNKRQITYNSELQSLEFEIYDINFNLKGESKLNRNALTHLESEFRVGDYLVFQTKLDATEDKYDYYETNSIGTKYYTLNTFKLNLKNADIAEVSFNYKIQSTNTSFNTKTALIYAQKIKNKQLTTSEILLINGKFQTKTLDYSFNNILQVSDNRYITYNTTTSGTKYNFNLIDRGYNIIAHLENFNEIYATNNAIIALDNTTAYICNFDGVVVKKISKSEFTYLFDDSYYMVSKEITSNDGNYTEYYLEELGLTQNTCLYSESSTTTYYKASEVNSVILINEEYATLIITTQANDEKYDYSIYNTSGKLLGTITGISDDNIQIDNMYFDDNYTVLKIDTKYVVLDR